MYYHASKIKKTFNIKRKLESSLNNRGRSTNGYELIEQTLTGTFSKVSERDAVRYKQMEHNISCTIIQEGAPIAGREDILVLDGRHFLIHDLRSPMGITSGIGARTVYLVEERSDLND